MQLQEFFDYKNVLMRKILTDGKLVHLLNEDIDIKDAGSLAYKQVFPVEYVADTIMDGMTFICFDVDVTRVYNTLYYSPVIYVWIGTHRSKLRLPNGGGVRTDAICSEICNLVNGSREFGLGETLLYSVKRWAPQTDYQGKIMAFNCDDFNTKYDANKFTPANRKKNVWAR